MVLNFIYLLNLGTVDPEHTQAYMNRELVEQILLQTKTKTNSFKRVVCILLFLITRPILYITLTRFLKLQHLTEEKL